MRATPSATRDSHDAVFAGDNEGFTGCGDDKVGIDSSDGYPLRESERMSVRVGLNLIHIDAIPYAVKTST